MMIFFFFRLCVTSNGMTTRVFQERTRLALSRGFLKLERTSNVARIRAREKLGARESIQSRLPFKTRREIVIFRDCFVSAAQILTRSKKNGALYFGEKVFIHIPRRRKSSIYALSGNIFLGGAPRDVSFTTRKVLRNVNARCYIAMPHCAEQ